MKYILIILLIASIFNDCQMKKQTKISDKNLLILSVLDSEYCKSAKNTYGTAAGLRVYNGINYIDIYKNMTFLFRSNLDPADISSVSGSYFKLQLKKTPISPLTVCFGVLTSQLTVVQH